MENSEVFRQQFEYFGLDVEFVREIYSPLAQTLFYNLKDIDDYNPKKISSIVEKMSVYSHVKLEWKKGTDTHIALTMFYNQPKILLRQLMSEDNFRNIVVGKDIENNMVSIDFDKSPHILIAGTTGAGKSVLMNTIICNIYAWYGKNGNRFKMCDLVLIDPKGCEFDKYRNCVNTRFIDDTQQAINYLRSACDEMDYRYKHMETPHHDLFIIIDELADLMLTSRFEVETSIVRLAQKGRACGIHLILATQRPVVSVISGLIKANITTRFALKVASIRDSINIIDHKGAEELNGNGDCLVKFPYSVNEVRCQLAFADNELIQKVVEVYSRR